MYKDKLLEDAWSALFHMVDAFEARIPERPVASEEYKRASIAHAERVMDLISEAADAPKTSSNQTTRTKF